MRAPLLSTACRQRGRARGRNGTAQSCGGEAGADLTVTRSTAAEPLERRIRRESFDSSLASLALGALNGNAGGVCRTKSFARFCVDTLSALLAPA